MSGFFNANKLVKRVDRLELLNSTLEIPSPSWGIIEGNLQDQEDLQTALDSKGGLRTFNQWSGTNIYTGQIQFHNQVYINDRTGIMFDPESTSISKQAYAQIAYRASTDRHFKFKVHGIPNSSFWGNLDFSGISASDKTFTFPNKSGTIALLDDVPDSVTTGFGLSTNGSGELELGSPVSGENIQQVSIPEGNALLLGSYATENPALIVNNQYNEIHMQTGDTEINGVQSSIFMSSEPEFFNNIGLTVDTPTTSSELILTTDSSKLSYTGNTIEINGSGTTITGEVNVPTPTADSHAATKAYVDANSGGGVNPTLDQVLTNGSTSSQSMTVGSLDVDSSIQAGTLTIAQNALIGLDLTVSGAITSNGPVISDVSNVEIDAADPRVLPTRDWIETNYVKQTSGTFIPTVVDSNGNAIYTPGSATGEYAKIGSIVYVTVSFSSIQTTGTPSGGHLYIGNLPFTSTGTNHAISVSSFQGSSSDFYSIYANVYPLSNEIRFTTQNALSGSTNGGSMTPPILTNGNIAVAGTYSTDE